MAGTDINTIVGNAIRRYFSTIGINSDLFDIDSLENSIAEIVYDPSEELEARKELVFQKIRGAIQDWDYKTACVYMNEGIDSKTISCDGEDSDWFGFISSLFDHYLSIAEPFISDFIGRIERKEVSTKLPLSGCYEMLASSLLAKKRKDEAVAAIDKAIKAADNPGLMEHYRSLKDFYSQL